MPTPVNPMVITLDHYNMMRKHFTQHYFLANCNSKFGGQDIQIPWTSFAGVVNNFIKTTGVQPITVALRFVHCYDTKKNELYFRLQICTMVPDPAKPRHFTLDVTKCAWYTIENGSIAPTGITDLYDQNYLDSFYYCEADVCSAASCVQLASDTGAVRFVRNQVMPWMHEVHKIHMDNNAPPKAIVCFASGSHMGASPAVKFPHSLMIYLRQPDGTPIMDNTIYPVEFQCKAGDLSTLCPVNCNVYILPA